MNISNSQVNRLRHFVRAGLRSLFRPEPQTAVEWADASYYLPKESAYQEGRWETLPFQISAGGFWQHADTTASW
ncbi:terminase [Escherichia coli]|nr:terminase [Escherichia coli]